MNGRPHKRFPWLWYILALFVIVAFAFAPVGSVILCAAIANAYGCKVDEGSASVHHQRTRSRRTSLFTRCDGLVHARHHSRRSGCIRWLADFSHSASRCLAKAHIRWDPSADSPIGCNSMRICELYFRISIFAHICERTLKWRGPIFASLALAYIAMDCIATAEDRRSQTAATANSLG